MNAAASAAGGGPAPLGAAVVVAPDLALRAITYRLVHKLSSRVTRICQVEVPAPVTRQAVVAAFRAKAKDTVIAQRSAIEQG